MLNASTSIYNLKYNRSTNVNNFLIYKSLYLSEIKHYITFHYKNYHTQFQILHISTITFR